MWIFGLQVKLLKFLSKFDGSNTINILFVTGVLLSKSSLRKLGIRVHWIEVKESIINKSSKGIR